MNAVRIFVSIMRLFNQLSSKMFMKVIGISKQSLSDLFIKAMSSSVIQTTYDEEELQVTVSFIK